MFKNTALLFIMLISLSFMAFEKSTKEQKPPNILFAISDDQSYFHTGFAGSTFVNTPAFDKIASEGIYFTNCYAGSPGCAPSRSALVTGRHHWQNEQSGQHASSWMAKHVPFIDLLDKNGYVTGRTGKGVGPFQYARNEKDSLWRKTDAGGLSYSEIDYTTENDDRFSTGIRNLNYYGNFEYFMKNVRGEKPFFFWYGGSEPHRKYEKGSWKRMGKQLSDIKEVPAFLPDNDEIRGDLLDYAVEIEWFDLHLQKMLTYLESIGELENTIVIVTADNGMPFPRAKANSFEYGVHVPFAVRYPAAFPGKRIVEDLIGFADIAPTILEMTNTSPEGMMPITGKSFLNLLKSSKQGKIDKNRDFVLAGRERHSSSRYENWGYPQRMIRSNDYIYIWNMESRRWPAGAPQRSDQREDGSYWPLYGLDEKGNYIPDAAFTDIDDCPSKTFLIENYKDPEIAKYFELSCGKRPEFELYNIVKDPNCLNNLHGKEDIRAIETKLKTTLISELKRSNDPRVTGPDPGVFDSYLRYSPIRIFPKPEWAN